LEAGERGGSYLMRHNALGFGGSGGERAETADAQQLAQRGLAARDLVGDEVGGKPAPRRAQAGDLRQALDRAVTRPNGIER
tara:strand:- start:441 stop:683 length:243 start_codon:yes stop_codon:yes gene_type:complete